MKEKDILFLLLSSVILTIAWIVFNIIHNSISSTITNTTNQQISSINPHFDTRTIDILKKRQGAIPVFNLGTSSQSSTSGVITTPTPVQFFPSPSLKPTIAPTNSASEGGTPKL